MYQVQIAGHDLFHCKIAVTQTASLQAMLCQALPDQDEEKGSRLGSTKIVRLLVLLLGAEVSCSQCADATVKTSSLVKSPCRSNVQDQAAPVVD